MGLVAQRVSDRKVLRLVRAFLRAGVVEQHGGFAASLTGTPQGGIVTPVLANLFMHYAFDRWMAREHPAVPFERYADDAVAHCVSERQARKLVVAIADRMAEVGLRLHPAKTRIVYCKDGKRRLDHEHTSFTFLGFTFRARKARGNNGRNFTRFCPRSARTP
jgi:RNA-directed DNA polymerase